MPALTAADNLIPVLEAPVVCGMCKNFDAVQGTCKVIKQREWFEESSMMVRKRAYHGDRADNCTQYTEAVPF